MSLAISVRFLGTQSDERLLAAAGAGHERAFEALIQRYRKPLLRHCRRLLLPEAAAEDALQQGLLHAWLALQRGTAVHDARAWLYRVVHNAAIDALRTSGYDHEQLSESLQGANAPQSDLDRRIAVRQALAGLATLPELQREALLRTAIEGHSHDQVATALGLSNGAVRGLIYRARATLRTAATAITPAPLVAWLSSAGERGAPLAQRLGEVGAGGGAAGAAGALFKGGAAMLTAGALVAGAVTVHHGAPLHWTHTRGRATPPTTDQAEARVGVSRAAAIAAAASPPSSARAPAGRAALSTPAASANNANNPTRVAHADTHSGAGLRGLRGGTPQRHGSSGADRGERPGGSEPRPQSASGSGGPGSDSARGAVAAGSAGTPRDSWGGGSRADASTPEAGRPSEGRGWGGGGASGSSEGAGSGEPEAGTDHGVWSGSTSTAGSGSGRGEGAPSGSDRSESGAGTSESGTGIPKSWTSSAPGSGGESTSGGGR